MALPDLSYLAEWNVRVTIDEGLVLECGSVQGGCGVVHAFEWEDGTATIKDIIERMIEHETSHHK